MIVQMNYGYIFLLSMASLRPSESGRRSVVIKSEEFCCFGPEVLAFHIDVLSEAL